MFGIACCLVVLSFGYCLLIVLLVPIVFFGIWFVLGLCFKCLFNWFVLVILVALFCLCLGRDWLC